MQANRHIACSRIAWTTVRLDYPQRARLKPFRDWWFSFSLPSLFSKLILCTHASSTLLHYTRIIPNTKQETHFHFMLQKSTSRARGCSQLSNGKGTGSTATSRAANHHDPAVPTVLPGLASPETNDRPSRRTFECKLHSRRGKAHKDRRLCSSGKVRRTAAEAARRGVWTAPPEMSVKHVFLTVTERRSAFHRGGWCCSKLGNCLWTVCRPWTKQSFVNKKIKIIFFFFFFFFVCVSRLYVFHWWSK